MAPLNLLVAGLNFTHADNIKDGVYRFIADRSLVLSGVESLSDAWSLDSWWEKALLWLSRPDVLAIITAWWITFTVVITIILCIGFAPVGIVGGSLAAAFQSYMYGGFTPAGGIFATLTSMAMLGIFIPWAVVIASILATGVAVIVWKLGVGLP